jgi:hypothetical protein
MDTALPRSAGSRAASFHSLKVEPKRKAEALTIIELPLGQQTLSVKWPSSDPEGCARFIRGLAQ